MKEKKLSLKDVDIPKFVGVQNINLRTLRSRIEGRLVFRGEDLFFAGSPEELGALEKIIIILKEKLRREGQLEELDVIDAVNSVKGKGLDEEFVIYTPKKNIRPRSPNQLKYLKAIEKSDIVVAIGPAGTGKTFLAVAMALKFLREKKVERIILTRPAVEAGESLGFLPGDYQEKIHPYLTPLYDALYAMLPPDRIKKLTDTGIIEIAPLAYMRGRTLSEAFVILDEGQNTRSVQMKMFLTRLGPKSKAVLTGDITQIDLPNDEGSGLVEIQKILKGIKGIEFCYFGAEDVIRHNLVKQIVAAYEKQKESKDRS